MRFISLLSMSCVLLPPSSALNILLNNDDSWASANIRELYKALKLAGHKVLLVAPVSNQSGRGGAVLPVAATPKLTSDGEFGAVLAGAPSWGTDPSDSNIWYYNGTQPDLLLSGPNEGNNLGLFAYTASGTIGAAYSAITRGVPAIAVSAQDLAHRPYTAVTNSSDVAILAANVTVKLLSFLVSKSNSTRLLPTGYGLNVNLPNLNSSCTAPTYVQTRLSSYESLGKWVVNETAGTAALSQFNDASLETCLNGDCTLPTENYVVNGGCAVSVAIFTTDYNAPNSTTTSSIREFLQPFVAYQNASTTGTTSGSNSTVTSVPKSASANVRSSGATVITGVAAYLLTGVF